MAQLRKISRNNTTVAVKDGVTTVTLYSTPVVNFDSEFITLDNGGFVTSTTVTRMNQVANQFDLGFHVSRKGGRMFVVDSDPWSPGGQEPTQFDRTITFNRKLDD